MINSPYNISLMFKPTLKRTLLKIQANKSKTLLPEHAAYSKVQSKSYMTELYKSPSNLIIPPILCSQSQTQTKETVFTPLNYTWHQYPVEAIKMINAKIGGENFVRDVGCYGEYFWCFNGIEMLIWKEKSTPKLFQLPEKAQFVSFGDLQNGSLHFKATNPIILVAGIKNYVHLFGLDRQTLACNDFKLFFQIANSSYIQKICFFDKNKIAIASDTGQHYVLDFTGELRIYKPQGSVIYKTLPYLPLLFPRKQRFCQKIIGVNDYLFSLVRQQTQRNWLSFKAKQLYNQAIGNAFNEQWIIQTKTVQIYKIHPSSQNVSLLHTITQNDLLRKSKLKVNANMNSTQQLQYCKIASINVRSENNILTLQIVTKSGVFLQFDFDQQILNSTNYFTFPTSDQIGNAGFFLLKNLKKGQPENKKQCLDSLGSNNLSLLDNSLWFIDQNKIEAVKNGGFKGNILQRKNSLLKQREWNFLTNKGYFRISQLSPADVLLTFIDIRDNQKEKNISQRWIDQANFQIFLKSLNNSIGQPAVIQSLISTLILGQTQVIVHNSIRTFIKKYLQNAPIEKYRDWIYELKEQVNQSSITIDTKMKEQIWLLIFTLQNTSSNKSNEDSIKQGSSYWQAIKNIFYSISKDVLKLKPTDVKANKSKIDKAINLLNQLTRFFKVKKEKETRFLDKLYIKRKDQRQESEDIFAVFKKKQQAQGTQKLEDSIETQAQKPAQKKLITESSNSLQNDITDAVSKLKALIEVFACLTEVSEGCNIPNIEKVLKSKEQQQIVKLRLLQVVQDEEKLLQLDSKLPQLQIRKDLALKKKMQKIKGFKWIEMVDLEQLASCLSSNYFSDVFQIFKQNPDLKVNLLLHYWTISGRQISASSKLFDLQNQRKAYYSEDSKHSLNENIQYYNKQQQKILQLIQQLITLTIKKYIDSNDTEYQKAQKTLNNIIQLIATHHSETIFSFLQNELKRMKVTQKLLLLKRLKVKPKPKITIEQHLMSRVAKVRKPPAVQREHMSNFDAYIFDSNL